MTRSYKSRIKVRADGFVDLQTHTKLSDGKWTPEALIDHFVDKFFATAAITDHDRVDTMDEIQDIARERDFPLLVAAEMTTSWRDKIVDILCFGFEKNPSPLSALCDAIHEAQSEVSRQVYNYLVSKNFIRSPSDADLFNILRAPTSRQPHMLSDLFGQHHPIHNADSYKPLNDAGYKLCTNPTAAVVEAVHQCGGVALIAHPGRTDGFATFDAALLDEFRAEIPIDGIEVYYPRHTPEQTAVYQAYADQHSWLISAGSDSHVPNQPPVKYRAEQCKALLARLDIDVV